MFRPLPILTAATAVALAILIALGVWQLERRAEKHALLNAIAARAEAPSAPVEILLVTGDYAAHRAATAQGTFAHGKESYVFHPRADKGPTQPGFKVITPFELLSGGTLLVDRGWVDQAQIDPATRALGQTEGEIELTGILRMSAKPATFTPPPDTDRRIFYARESSAIGKRLGLTLRSPLILELTAKVEGGPEPLPSTLNIPDNHLQYALTWFSFAIILVVIYLRLHMLRGRLRFSR
ncbi:MAG: SURF1 family protein [Alphaproteobacteria bacterium]|nr:SURF1 family protein [Alphaproteobacteria bacterium]